MSHILDNLPIPSYPFPTEKKGVTAPNKDKLARTKTSDVLVLDAKLRQSLVSVRSLGKRELLVAALDTAGVVPAFSSRWCRQSFLSPVDQDAESYLIYLEQILNSVGAKVLIASSDSTVALIRQHRERLDKLVGVALAKDPALGIAINKEQTLEIARQLGLGIPPGVTIMAVSEVPAALHEIPLPAVVKPIESWLWDGQYGKRLVSELVTTPDEARRVVEELTWHGGSVLFQQFLTGRREAMSFMYANGEIYARFAQWAKRTEPPLGGQSVLRQSISMPDDIGPQAERLVREIGLEGYSEVEFRRDSAGVPYLMEINPRLSASVEIAVRSGVDFPLLLYQWASGDRIDCTGGYRVGKWMRYLKGDIAGTIETIQQRGRPGVTPPMQAIFAFFGTFFVPMMYDYVDWRDPLPAAIATADFTRLWVGGAIKKRVTRIKEVFK